MAKIATPRRFLRRLKEKSWAELAFRGRQQARNRWDGLLHYLGWSKSFDRQRRMAATAQTAAANFFFSAHDLPQLLEILRTRLPESVEETIEQAEKACAHHFDLLGYAGLDYGPQIDWHLDRVHNKRAPKKLWYRIAYLDFDTCGDVKITWELNRHQHWVTLGKAYQLSRDEKYALEFARQFGDWQRQNPYPVGVNWASSLEVAFRSLSWLWARELFAGAASLPTGLAGRLLAALGSNARFIERNLSTYFSANTHLLGEAVGLFFIGTLCPELRGAKHWQELGWKILLQEAERQVRADGGYFEQSTYYHVYALDFLLHARILASHNQIPIPETLDTTIVRMLEYLAALGTAGPPPRFGDDDGGRVFNPRRNRAEHLLDPLSTGAVLFHSPEFKAIAKNLREETLWLLGPTAANEFDRLPTARDEASSRSFPETGTYVLASPGLRLAVDAGPLGVSRGGHGHADALSICAAANGSEWLNDPGTFTYTASREWRDRFRGTPAHNTLTVDGADQAEAIEPFAWAHLPKSRVERWLPGATFDLLVAAHDGYLRLASPVGHRRLVFFVKNRFWLVVDAAEGHGEHNLELCWHFGSERVALAGGSSSNRAVVAGYEDSGPREGGAELFSVVPLQDPQWKVDLADAWWSPHYGAKQSRQMLRCSGKVSLPAEFATVLVPRARSLEGRLERLAAAYISQEAGGVRGYRYLAGPERHDWILADRAERWRMQTLESDAPMAYCAWNGDRITQIILCDGTYLALQGENLLSTDRRCTRIEYRWSNGLAEQFTSDDARLTLRPELCDGRDEEMAGAGAGKKEAIDCT